jgi:hypothetical protein
MERTVNRWLTGVLLFCFLAIIAFAAGRQNGSYPTVLVMNNTSQPVPIAQIATLNTNDITHGKDGLQVTRPLPIPANFVSAELNFNAIPGERFVITDIEVTYPSITGDYMTAAGAAITDAHGNHIASNGVPVTAQAPSSTSSYSFGHWQGNLYLDNGQNIAISVSRHGTVAGTAYVTYSGYRVAYP